MRPRDIAIVGCGVGGLATALFLKRAGFRPVLFERFETPRPTGAGLLLQPTGLEVLGMLDLREAVEAAGARISGITGHTVSGRRVLDLSYTRFRPGAYGVGVQRSALFGALFGAVEAEGIPIETGWEVADIPDPARPVAVDARGRASAAFDLAIVADGARSALRERLAPKTPAPEYPWGAFWTVMAPGAEPSAVSGERLEQIYRRAEVMVGILPVGFPAPEGEGPGHLGAFWSLPTARMATVRAAGFDRWIEEVAGHWPEAADLLSSLRGWDGIYDARYFDVRMRNPVRGATLFIGDAAHGTSPQLGQGANLALLDAMTLTASLLSAPADPESALAAYARARAPQIRFYRTLSRWMTPAFQSNNRLLVAARDLVLPLLCDFPPTQTYMMRTLAGMQNGFLGTWRPLRFPEAVRPAEIR